MRATIAAVALLSTLSATAYADPTQPPPAPAPTPATGVAVTAPSSFATPGLRGPTLWGILPWGGLGIGGRFMIPLGVPGVIHGSSVHDTFAVEVGADLLHWSHDYGIVGAGGGNYSWTEILAVGGVMWNFWITDQLALYPKIDLGYAFGWYSGFEYSGRPSYGGLFVSGDAGAIYKLGGGVSLRAELGTDGLKAGAGWLF